MRLDALAEARRDLVKERQLRLLRRMLTGGLWWKWVRRFHNLAFAAPNALTGRV